MSKLNWEIVHECDDDNGNPTQWCAIIDHPKYGKFCWITDMADHFSIEVDCEGFVEIMKCKSLPSAKKWVTTQLMNKK